MIQMKLSVKQKQTHRHKTESCGGVGEGQIGSLGLTDANYYTQNGSTARSYWTAQGTLFNIL